VCRELGAAQRKLGDLRLALGFGRSGALTGVGRQDGGVGSGLGSREVLVGAVPRNDVARMWAGDQTSCLTTFDAARCTKKPYFAAGRQRLGAC
jgi:hypothetical protein